MYNYDISNDISNVTTIAIRLSEWERRYKSRDSKPEDIAAIRELRSIVREQEQRMKDLVVRGSTLNPSFDM